MSAGQDITVVHDMLFSAVYTPHASSGIYCLLFNKDNEALLMTSIPFSFGTFSGPNQTNFAIELSQHAQRTRHFENTLHCTGFTIPDNAYGESYTLEIWCKEVSGAVFDRTVDKLVEVQKLIRFGGENAESVLTEYQETLIGNKAACLNYNSNKGTVVAGSWGEYFDHLADTLSDAYASYPVTGATTSGTIKWAYNEILSKTSLIPEDIATTMHECHSGIGWDSANSILNLNCFLEVNGEVLTNPTSANFKILKDDGSTVVDTDMGTPSANGVFFKAMASITLNPDRLYFALVSIVDNNAITRTSGSSPITWD